MSGIIFPDFARSFGAGQALRQNEQQNAFQMDRARRADEADALDRETGQHFGAAIQGDKGAQARVMTNPKYALPLLQYLDKADAGARSRLKEQFEATGKAAAGILALPDADQPAAYEAIYQQLTQQGYKINLPPRWSPALKGQLQSYAVQVPEYLKMIGNEPQPMGPGPGAAPPAGASGDVLTRTKQAISGNESGGRYDAVGPDTGGGKKAYGKYQVMDFNVGPWTQEAIGRPMTPQEFLASPQAQEAVADFKLGQYIKQFGSPEAAARAWFAGPGGMNNTAAKDVLGTTVGGYSQKFSQQYGDGATGSPPGMAVGDTQPPAADANGNALPPQAPQQEVFEINSWLSKAMPGARPMGVKGKPVRDSQGLLMVLKPDGTTGWVEVPKQAPTPPIGYRAAPGGGLEPIPGGPADPTQAKAIADAKRRADEKATPQSVAKGMQENLTALKKIDAAVSALDDPKAKGSVGGIGGWAAAQVPVGADAMNYFDPSGTTVRALIADIGSLKIHDRSGAAVTAAETPRLKPFVPSVGDSPQVIKDKLQNFRVEYEGMLRDSLEFYSEQNGFKPYTPALDYLNRAPAQPPTAPPQGAPTPPAATPPSAGPPRIGANGEGYDQIPPGAQYLAPDGTTRTKGGR